MELMKGSQLLSIIIDHKKYKNILTNFGCHFKNLHNLHKIFFNYLKYLKNGLFRQLFASYFY